MNKKWQEHNGCHYCSLLFIDSQGVSVRVITFLGGDVEEILERTLYPSAPLFECPCPPISEGEITALMHNLQDEPTFRGVWTVANDGTPVAILHALGEKNFRAARKSMTGVLAWSWPNHFGHLVSFTLVIPGERSPRIFVPDDCALIRLVSDRGRIAFAVGHGKQLSPFYLADFTKHPEHPDMLDAFRALLRFDEHFVFRDDELAYWLFMSDSKSNWIADLPIRDAMRARWARIYESQVLTLVRRIEEIRANGLPDTAYTNADAQTNIPFVMPFFDEVASLLISPTSKTLDAIKLACTALADPHKMGNLIHGLIASIEKNALVADLALVIHDLLMAVMYSHTATISGLRRPWLDARLESGDVAVRYIDIDYLAFGKDAPDYWFDWDLNYFFDFGYVLTGKDLPLPITQHKEFSDIELGCTKVEADAAIRELLAEARENRQWSAPWGARVQIDVGPLKYLDIFEIEGEFIGMFRDTNDRFLMVQVNISSGAYTLPTIIAADEDAITVENNTQASLALVLVVASVVRDFVVVEERTSQFVARPAKQRRCSTNQALSIIYLPRVRYLHPDVDAFHNAVGSDTHRAAHDVAQHIRKTEHASAAQLLLAMRYGLGVPKGYTFVRPHRRGDVATPGRQRLYRSRSASAILYRTLTKAPTGSRPAWFDFEKDVAVALSKMSFRVVHQAASRNGDGGVDIYAHDEVNDHVWAVQCKCYATARKVGPDVVRELAGSLHRYPEGTRGMIVTTSSYTPTALEEAAALNIKTIDGPQFVALAKITHAGPGTSKTN